MLALTACTSPRIDDAELIESDTDPEVSSSFPPEPQETPAQIPEILQNAEIHLDLVLGTGFEWMVHEDSVSSQPISLSELLLAARQHYENDNPLEGERLALLVSEFARIALEQHLLNQKYLLDAKNLYRQ
ncbi:MAG: hypothetical protein OXD44_10885 [Gammaproteobacteria bacterium]|nr:hypothetical protein [Gammaproteobacteria bacterium]